MRKRGGGGREGEGKGIVQKTHVTLACHIREDELLK
jgi:hypothetical protein